MGKNRPRPSIFPLQSKGLAAFARTLAVLALAIQCLVVQTHVDIHDESQAGAASVRHATISVDHDGSAPTHRAAVHCIICQTAAATRTSVTPTFALPLIERAALPVALQTTALRAPRIAAHAWQSRAPPTQI